MLLRRGGTERVLASIPAVLSPAEVLALQEETENVAVSEPLLDYLHALVRATRRTAELRLPVSTRGAQALFRAVQAHALLQGRELRDARRRAGRRRARPRAPHPLGLLRRLRRRRARARDRAEDPGGGGGAGLVMSRESCAVSRRVEPSHDS